MLAGSLFMVFALERASFTVSVTVFSRELLVLQALKDFKELILLPQLCLQQCHLSANGSS